MVSGGMPGRTFRLVLPTIGPRLSRSTCSGRRRHRLVDRLVDRHPHPEPRMRAGIVLVLAGTLLAAVPSIVTLLAVGLCVICQLCLVTGQLPLKCQSAPKFERLSLKG